MLRALRQQDRVHGLDASAGRGAANSACPQNCCYLKTSAAGRRAYNDSVSGTIGPLPPVPSPPPPPPPPAPSGMCTAAHDCSLGGLCVAGKCACDPAFTGPNCAALNLQLAPRTPLWDAPPRTSSWGGNMVWDGSDGKWHLFFAEFLGHCGLDSWGTNSQVSHATADHPAGPYTKQGVVQAPFHHNPSVAYDNSTGTFLLYSIGNGSATPTNCTTGVSGEMPGKPAGNPSSRRDAPGLTDPVSQRRAHAPQKTLPVSTLPLLTLPPGTPGPLALPRVSAKTLAGNTLTHHHHHASGHSRASSAGCRGHHHAVARAVGQRALDDAAHTGAGRAVSTPSRHIHVLARHGALRVCCPARGGLGPCVHV